MAWGGIDTTPPEYWSASTCRIMIRPLVDRGLTGVGLPVGPNPAPVISTFIAFMWS